jgi:hypothetical protein
LANGDIVERDAVARAGQLAPLPEACPNVPYKLTSVVVVDPPALTVLLGLETSDGAIIVRRAPTFRPANSFGALPAMISRLLVLALVLSAISFLMSAALNWHLYDHLVGVDGTKFSAISEIANLPGVPVYLVFGDHLANRNDDNAIRRNVLLLLISGTVGWSMTTFAIVFFWGLLVLQVVPPKQ